MEIATRRVLRNRFLGIAPSGGRTPFAQASSASALNYSA